MAELLHEYAPEVTDSRGNRYRVRAMAEARADGDWIGWLEFVPAGSSVATLRTGRETTQPDREKLVYWAAGLEPIYLDGALARAKVV